MKRVRNDDVEGEKRIKNISIIAHVVLDYRFSDVIIRSKTKTFKSFKCVLSCIKYFNDAFNIGIVYFSLTQFSNKAVSALLRFVNETDNWEIDDYRGISDFLDLLKFVGFIDDSSYDIIDRLNFIEQLS